MISLTGKSIVVTGAAQGIGRAISELVVALGGNAVLVDRNEAAVRELADTLGPAAMARVGDVADPQFVAQSIDAAVGRFGGIEGLVNNAGVTRPAMIAKMSLADWNQVLEVNLTAPFLWLQAVGRHLIERVTSGEAIAALIVNVSSDAGKAGTIGQINYGASKAGILGETMSAAKEWGKHNIRVNSVYFGLVETPMTEVVRSERFRDGYVSKIALGRWAQPEEVAKPVCFLLSDAASFITGHHLGVNGGSFMAA